MNERGIFWCETCCTVFKAEVEGDKKTHVCFNCGNSARYLTTDVRPVFSRERRILQFYGHGTLLTEQVWRSSKSPNYYIDGRIVALPNFVQLKDDLPAIGDFIADSDHYDAVDKQLIEAYRRILETNRTYLNGLEDEAFRFVQKCVKRFTRRMLMVSFSGGKDSTAVSDIVRRA